MSGNKSTAVRTDESVEWPVFWEGVRRGVLSCQRCLNCEYMRWPPGPICPECQKASDEWAELTPRGTLISYAVYHRALDPTFHRPVPYVVGYIQLQDGPRIYGLVNDDPANVTVGNVVTAVFPEEDGRMVEWAIGS